MRFSSLPLPSDTPLTVFEQKTSRPKALFQPFDLRSATKVFVLERMDNEGQIFNLFLLFGTIGLVGFEPTASWSRTRRSTKLSHSPN
jgi:hypothetical protein